MIVLKFGGKSLATKQKIRKICKYIKLRAQSEKLVIVVSAMADSTDKLLALSSSYSKSPSPREVDMLLSCGESISASLVAITLNSMGVKALSLLGWQAGIYCEGKHTECRISRIDPSPILTALEKYDCAVVAGFQGVSDEGEIVTIGRGGSDTSAVALGYALKCKVEIYSDFDGICAGDPRNLNYKKYNEIDYASAFSYAKTGAKVLSEPSAALAEIAKVEVVCKCSHRPHLDGTKIVELPSPFVAINVTKGLCEVIITSNFGYNLTKSMNFLLKNVNFKVIEVKKASLRAIVSEKDLPQIEKNLAKINNLLKNRQKS